MLSFCCFASGYLRDASDILTFAKFVFFFLFCNRWHPANLSGAVGSLMAIINSVGVGRGSKSVGEFTYRYTRGRTIASRRITRNASKTPAQVGRRGAFGSFVWMFSPYKWFFSDGYEKTKHGSSFNQFVHVNRELLGKSPYNSEVNKKLIPNGARLYSLFSTIAVDAVPNLKYATFGSLDFVDESPKANGYFYSVVTKGNIYLSDFNSINIRIVGFDSKGNTFDKNIELYINSKLPTFNYSTDVVSTLNTMTVTTYQEEGRVNININGNSAYIWAMGIGSVTQEISANMNVFISQYGKFASIKFFLHAYLKPSE